MTFAFYIDIDICQIDIYQIDICQIDICQIDICLVRFLWLLKVLFWSIHINEQYLNSDVKYEIGIMYFYLCPCNQLLPPLKASGFTLLSCHGIVLGYIHVVQEVFHFWCYVFCFCPVFAVKITSPSRYGNYICKGGIVICLACHISTFSEKENLQRNISKRKGCRMAPWTALKKVLAQVVNLSLILTHCFRPTI